MAGSDSQIDKPQPGHPNRGELAARRKYKHRSAKYYTERASSMMMHDNFDTHMYP